MAKLQFSNWTLKYSVPRKNDSAFEILGKDIRMDPASAYWWVSPYFLSQLDTPTFGAIRDFFFAIIEERERQAQAGERRSHVPVLRDMEVLCSHWEDYGMLNYEVYSDPRSIPARIQSHSGFTLFPRVEGAPETNAVPEYEFNGSVGNWLGGDQQLRLLQDSSTRRSTSGDTIRPWNWKPDRPNFMSGPNEKTVLYFGLELEVNTRIPWPELRKVMNEVEPKQEEFLYAMSDSSVSGRYEHNYEIVSHPMSPRRMRREYRIFFRKLEKLVEAQGLTMGDVFDMRALTNGIHIHTSAAAYSKHQRRKFSAVWNSDLPSMKKTLSKLAGRELVNYCKPSPAYEGRRLGYCLKNTHYYDKYVACNDTGRSQTVEVRVFKGTPTIENILGCIDTVEAMFHFTLELPNSSIGRNFERTLAMWLRSQPTNKYTSIKEKIQCD